MSETVRVRRALLSVSDKSSLHDFAKALHQSGIALIASGGTADALKQHAIPHDTIESLTAMPPLFDGRVKTLHPLIHGGILARHNDKNDARDLKSLGADFIDLVVVNLYPFVQQRAQHNDDALIEWIDIGGPALIRAAAKNHERVTVLSHPRQYNDFLRELKRHKGHTSASYRRKCAAAAFAHTHQYDGEIAQWLNDNDDDSSLPSHLFIHAPLRQTMRYGENPHQQGGFYESAPPSLIHAKQWQGKELSWNNVHDGDVALCVVRHCDAPCAAVIKHATVCGAARAENIDDALARAIAADATSAFGGIIALNRPCDAAAARQLTENFFEVIIAPAIHKDALPILKKRANLRVLTDEALFRNFSAPLTIRSVQGGFLVQDDAAPSEKLTDWTKQTAHAITSAQEQDLEWAWRVARFVRSNAIVIVKDGQTIGIGGGATSRIDALAHALRQATLHHGKEALQHAVLASDAFFPFDDAIHEAAKHGIAAIIASGGALRDKEVIAACQKHSIALFFSPYRFFKH